VQIVEDDEERRIPCSQPECGRHGIEELKAMFRGVRLARAADALRARARKLGQDPSEDLARVSADCGRFRVAEQGAKQLHPGPVRRSAADLPTSAPPYAQSAIGSPQCELVAESRLTNASLARQQKQTPATGNGFVEPKFQLAELAIASNKRASGSLHRRC
jgi:hypothetical protein